MADQPTAPTGVDPTVPHSARWWNYLQGGQNWYEADKEAAEQFSAMVPEIRDLALASRQFLQRSVRWAAEHGLRQFLDLGAGLPAEPNVHELAQRAHPAAAVVYVDNDPMVLLHRRAYLDSTPEGRTAYLDADLRDTARILQRAGETLDLSRPVAIVLSDVLGHVHDDAEAAGLVRELVAAAVPGSALVLSHSAPSPRLSAAADAYADTGGLAYRLRPTDQIARFFTGLTLVEPGLVPMPDWRPDGVTHRIREDVGYGAVGLVP
ncbi:S-adenosyl methyltransferase [Streptomyces solincola]|uniref:S-adenosyl methyltransferase n=1 Tax=Streptomyces solincola TaxID=2100817 RepID=A0A2S9PTV0_9ACTN|nr:MULTISPECIES: SAM-dependent methyltransferase [Streptomyces]PRH77841.1 S-adenosyl methyltransferase [Streptomyces solincola]